MTRDDRPTSRDREQTQPDGIAARGDNREKADKGSVETAAPNDSSRKPFDPWRYGFHTVSAEHRRELLEMQLPETPAERLFDPAALDSKPDASSSAPPALTVDATAQSDQGSAARKADTLRLRRGPPLINPLRTAAPWAAGAALLVIALLWLLTGGSDTKHSSNTAAGPPSTTSVAPRSTGAPATPVTAAQTDEPLSAPTSATDEPSVAAKPAVAAKRAEPPKTRPVTAPALTPPPTPPAAATPPATKKAPDDDASPFGTWTAPPRD